MSLRQDFKKHSGRLQAEVSTQVPSRQTFIKATIQTLKKENEAYDLRMSKLSEQRAKLRKLEREVQEKKTKNEWRISDYEKTLTTRK